MKADLHMHSTDSDGRKTAKELFEIAKSKNIDVVAITDHDLVYGVEEKMALAKEYDITYIPAVELSTVYKQKPVHLLGYFKDDSYNNKELQDYFIFIKDAREKRAKKMIENLKKYNNIEISYDEVYESSEGIIARPHIAKAIMKNYKQYDHNYIFDHFIGDHAKAYVPTSELSVEEGIKLLKRNNCFVSLAHPTLLKNYIKEDVVSYNYDAIEARYYRNRPGDESAFRDYASSRNMLVTAGSDYHGIDGDEKHGDLGEITLDGEDLQKFLKKMNIKR